MRQYTRRDVLKTGAGLAVGAATLSSAQLLSMARAWSQDSPWQPEDGAELRILRWKRFVESEGEAFLKMVNAWGEANGVAVRVDSEGFEDLRPKAAVAANVGSGPDIVWSIHADPHLYPDKLIDVKDVADYLGEKYGGWAPVAEEYSVRDGRWISLPYTFNGNMINYRISHVQAAGFDDVPGDLDGFMQLMKGLHENGTPGGFALGNASGDGNSWTHWLLWAHGGKMVDEENNVVINSPETVAALEYIKEMGQYFAPGTASWLDGHNNKAFLAGQCSLTNNGISIYAAAQRENPEIAEDMDHAYWPVGVSGEPTELHVQFPMMVYAYTQYPNAAKSLLAWLMEADQYNTFLQESVGYLTHTLNAYDDHPVWEEDPKRLVFKDAVKRSLKYSHAGDLGYQASEAFADFVVVNMVAEAATGTKTPQQAAEDAARRAERYYRS